MLVSRRTRGACAALVWMDEDSRYRCGLIAYPAKYLPHGWRWAAAMFKGIAYRYVSAGTGCDSSVEVLQPGVTSEGAS
jgi:hypothetical protein